MIELAVATGIAPSVWADEGLAAIVTAEQVVNQMHGSESNGDDEPLMSG